MSEHSFSQYRSPPRTEPAGLPTTVGHIPATAVRVLCGVTAPLGFGCAGLCFYFLVEPFGANPPPKEVALIAGIVFTCFGLGLASVAIFYRGSPGQRATASRRLDALSEPVQRWSPIDPAAGKSSSLEMPATRSAKSRRGLLGELMGVTALLGILIGPLIGYLAFQRQQVLELGKPEPKVVRVSELGRSGPGDNIHVKITDFTFGTKYSVSTKNGSWQSICLAAFPKDKPVDPRALKVVVRTSRPHNEQELREFAKRGEIEGVVVNAIYEWENDKEYMKEAYPGVDTSAIWVVQENYTFPNAAEIKTMYAISSGIVGLAVFCGLGAFIRKRG